MTVLTDEQMAVLEAQAAAGPLTDEQLDSLSVMSQTPFGQKALPAAPARMPEQAAEAPKTPPQPLTDRELNQREEELYRDPSYIMPREEYRAYWQRRREEDGEVGRFFSGLAGGAQGLASLGLEFLAEQPERLMTAATDPLTAAKRELQTGAEAVRKIGVGLPMLYDWVANKVEDIRVGAIRGEAVNAKIRDQLQAEGKLTGNREQDEQIFQAARLEAQRAGAYQPTADQEEEDADRAYDRYLREKAFEQEYSGVVAFKFGDSEVSAPATTKETYDLTGAEPYEATAMAASIVGDPLNALPVGAGAMSKLRVLRRMAYLSGMPLRGAQKTAAAAADLSERAALKVSDKLTDLTGFTPKQQAAVGAGAAGLIFATGQQNNPIGQAALLVGGVMPALRYGGAILRRAEAAAGGAQMIVREAGTGGLGVARAEAAATLAANPAIPARYGRYFKGYVDGTDSTLKRVSMNPENPEMLRRVARLGDRMGVSTAARLTDDVVSGGLAATAFGAPFAAIQPDAERAGEMLGAIAMMGGVASGAARAVGRSRTAVDADIARMLADVQAAGGDAAGMAALPHATLDQMSAMQGVLAGKVDFIPLRADEFRATVDMPKHGGETPAGMFVDKDGTGRARIFINLDANRAAGAIVPHEIGHAILTSNILDGEPRADLRNLVNQQYGTEGVAARGREYAARIVDSDIANGTTGEPPKVMTEAEFRDLDAGRRTPAEVSRQRKMEPAERERLINERIEELEQKSIENGGDRLDWARDEIIAETFASEAPAIDFRGIRRDAMFPRMAESMLATGGRVLEMMGVRLDPGTGKMLDNPSVLFRDNPLFQDRIMQKRVKEYVRAYDQFLTGLEEAGSATPRGVELARSSRPEDLGRSTHVKLRDEGRGVLENDFLFQKPDGTYAFKPQKIINAAEANRAAQIKTLYDGNKFVPVNSTEFGKRKVNGREVVGGPVLPPQFDLFTQFPQHVRQFARGMEASRAEGGSWNIDYNAIGTGSSGRYRITNMGAVRAIQRETVPFGWQVTKQNHLLAASLDLNAFRAAAMKAVNRGELGIFNNDMRQLEADLKTYLANHRNGLPGEATIGQQKRDTLNGLIGTGTAVQRSANPLYSDLNPKGSIRTWRIDRLNDAQPSGRTGYFFDYDKINNNRMPQQIPREAQGMPDAPASGRGDGMPDRKSLQQRAKDLGLPATGTTKEIARMVSIGEKNPYEWTREEFNEIAPHLSIHQDIRPGSDARAQQIMERGLQSGMVDSVGAWGRNHTWAGGKMAGDNAYLFVSSKLKYRPGNLNPWLDEGNIPIARIKTKPGQTDIYEALIASRPQDAPSAAPRGQAMPDVSDGLPRRNMQSRGKTEISDDGTITYNGKEPADWAPEDFAAFGKEFGVRNLGPLTKVVSITDDVGRDIAAIPGGLDGKFSYYDLLWLKANPIDVKSLPVELHGKLTAKLARTMTPESGNNVQKFNGIVFGFLSANAPLLPNEMGQSRLRFGSMKEIADFGNLLPDNPTPAQLAEVNTRLKNQLGFSAASEGGMGIGLSQDLSNVVMAAKMFTKNPDFFIKRADESWGAFVDKASTQLRGLGTKTASFGAVWQDPLAASISAMDRHMSRVFSQELLTNPVIRQRFEGLVVKRFNSGLEAAQKMAKSYDGKIKRAKNEQAREKLIAEKESELAKLPDPLAIKAKTIDDVLGQSQLFGEQRVRDFINEAVFSAMGTRKGKYITAKGEVSPNVPESIRGVEWVETPQEFQVMSDAYRAALEINEARAKDIGIEVFPAQWTLWDRIRQRIEPHEAMFPGLEKLPALNDRQLGAAFAANKAAGYMTTPEQGKAWRRQSGISPSSLAYFTPAVLAAGAAASQEQ